MFEFTDEPVCDTAAELGADMHSLLQTIGAALLCGAPWENVFGDPRWTQRLLHIVYTHDQLGTPDAVEGVCFDRQEAEALARRLTRQHSSAHPLQHHFYKCKTIEWRLGTLALREARDSFHRDVIKHLVRHIKAAVLTQADLPEGITEVTVDSRQAAANAYIDLSGRRIVLWEDGCSLTDGDDSIDFTIHAKPPLCGLMNGRGDILVPAAFQHIAPLRHGVAVAKRNGKFGYIDAGGSVIVPFIYEAAADCCQDILLVKSGGLWGAIDRDGNEVIALRYDALEHDVGNEALRATLDGKYAYLSLHGELLVGFADQPLLLAEHSFAVDRAVFIARDTGFGGDQHVLVDAQGRQIGMHAFAAIEYGFPDGGLLCAKMQDSVGSHYGYINLHGDAMIPFHFTQAGNFSEGLAAASIGDAPSAQYGYIDRHGNWAIAPAFDMAGEFHQGLAPASGPGIARKWSWELSGLSELWTLSGLSALLDKPATPPKPAAKPAAARRFGYIDRQGKWVIGQHFLEAKPFSEGMAPVRLDNGWGYIDINGSIGIPGPFHEAGPFKQGVARVARRYDGPLRWGLIDVCGREIIPLRFDRLSYPKHGLLSACDEYGLWGCFTLFGNIVLPFIYRDARDLQRALAARSTLPQSPQ